MIVAPVVGQEVTIKAKVAGFVDFGKEVQLQLPSGLFTYLPTEEVTRALNE